MVVSGMTWVSENDFSRPAYHQGIAHDLYPDSAGLKCQQSLTFNICHPVDIYLSEEPVDHACGFACGVNGSRYSATLIILSDRNAWKTLIFNKYRHINKNKLKHLNQKCNQGKIKKI